MLLAAQDGTQVEVLFADHAQPGDRVTLEGEREPETAARRDRHRGVLPRAHPRAGRPHPGGRLGPGVRRPAAGRRQGEGRPGEIACPPGLAEPCASWSLLAALPLAAQEQSWYLILLGGKRVGTQSETFWPQADGERRTELFLRLTVSRFGQAFTIAQRQTWIEDEHLRSLESETDLNGEARIAVRPGPGAGSGARSNGVRAGSASACSGNRSPARPSRGRGPPAGGPGRGPGSPGSPRELSFRQFSPETRRRARGPIAPAGRRGAGRFPGGAAPRAAGGPGILGRARRDHRRGVRRAGRAAVLGDPRRDRPRGGATGLRPGRGRGCRGTARHVPELERFEMASLAIPVRWPGGAAPAGETSALRDRSLHRLRAGGAGAGGPARAEACPDGRRPGAHSRSPAAAARLAADSRRPAASSTGDGFYLDLGDPRLEELAARCAPPEFACLERLVDRTIRAKSLRHGFAGVARGAGQPRRRLHRTRPAAGRAAAQARACRPASPTASCSPRPASSATPGPRCRRRRRLVLAGPFVPRRPAVRLQAAPGDDRPRRAGVGADRRVPAVRGRGRSGRGPGGSAMGAEPAAPRAAGGAGGPGGQPLPAAEPLLGGVPPAVGLGAARLPLRSRRAAASRCWCSCAGCPCGSAWPTCRTGRRGCRAGAGEGPLPGRPGRRAAAPPGRLPVPALRPAVGQPAGRGGGAARRRAAQGSHGHPAARHRGPGPGLRGGIPAGGHEGQDPLQHRAGRQEGGAGGGGRRGRPAGLVRAVPARPPGATASPCTTTTTTAGSSSRPRPAPPVGGRTRS